MPTQQKMAAIEELVREWSGARSVVLADFIGMDVATISELRRRCRAEKVTFRVAKNTLSKRAFEQMGMGELGPFLEGPTGVAVTHGDEMAAVRVLTTFAKENEKPQLKGGMVEGRLYSLEEIKVLASLPPRDQLLGQLLMTFEAPLTQVISALSGLASDFISIIDQLAERRGGGAAAPTTAPEVAAAEAAPAAGDPEAGETAPEIDSTGPSESPAEENAGDASA